MNDRPRTLAIATGHALSVALYSGSDLLSEHHDDMRRGHAENVIPVIERILAGCRPDDMVVERGPGSFTGLRIGLAAARALALAWDIPLRGVRSTLMVAAAIRAEEGESRPLLVALKAPRRQHWAEIFAAGSLESVRAPFVIPEGDPFPEVGGGRTVAIYPRAAHARYVPESALERPEPLYVRAG